MVLEVPKSYEFIKIDQTNSSDILYGFGEIFKEYEIELEFFVVAPRIVLETVQLIINGKRLEDIKILKPNAFISTNDVINTNYCHISICKSKIKNKIIILSAIDNLIKGASGQAVQNMNIIYNLNEKIGLK